MTPQEEHDLRIIGIAVVGAHAFHLPDEAREGALNLEFTHGKVTVDLKDLGGGRWHVCDYRLGDLKGWQAPARTMVIFNTGAALLCASSHGSVWSGPDEPWAYLNMVAGDHTEYRP